MFRKIPPERKFLFYGGNILAGIGFILFISVFFSKISAMGSFQNFETRVHSNMTRAVTGMIFIVVGQIISKVGSKGLAGSGIILDPEQAEKDIKPYSRMTGGIIKDVLSEAEIDLSGTLKAPQKVIKIRCQSCNELNEEDAKFCKECGQPI